MHHGTVLYAEQVLNRCLFERDYSYVSFCTLCFGNCTGQFPVGPTVRSQPVIEVWWYRYRDHFVHAPSQWQMTLQCNISSHWLGAYTKWSLSHHWLWLSQSCHLIHQVQWNLIKYTTFLWISAFWKCVKYHPFCWGFSMFSMPSDTYFIIHNFTVPILIHHVLVHILYAIYNHFKSLFCFGEDRSNWRSFMVISEEAMERRKLGDIDHIDCDLWALNEWCSSSLKLFRRKLELWYT